jgi:hypothetical protein
MHIGQAEPARLGPGMAPATLANNEQQTYEASDETLAFRSKLLVNGRA